MEILCAILRIPSPEQQLLDDRAGERVARARAVEFFSLDVAVDRTVPVFLRRLLRTSAYRRGVHHETIFPSDVTHKKEDGGCVDCFSVSFFFALLPPILALYI